MYLQSSVLCFFYTVDKWTITRVRNVESRAPPQTYWIRTFTCLLMRSPGDLHVWEALLWAQMFYLKFISAGAGRGVASPCCKCIPCTSITWDFLANTRAIVWQLLYWTLRVKPLALHLFFKGICIQTRKKAFEGEKYNLNCGSSKPLRGGSEFNLLVKPAPRLVCINHVYLEFHHKATWWQSHAMTRLQREAVF